MEASGSPPRPTPSRRHRGLRAFGNPLEWSDIQKTILIFFPPIPFTLFYIWRIRGLLAGAGVTPRQLGAVVCGVGPGTFTGTRVALAF